MSTPPRPSPPPARTLAELRASGWTTRSVKAELRGNFERALAAAAARGERGAASLFPGIVGYDDTVLPDLATAIIAGHDLLFLGEKGQGKSLLMRMLPGFLDEWLPYLDIPGCPAHEDPDRPITRAGRELIASAPAERVPIAWWHRDDRYAERLAPGTKFADLIGEIDPAKLAAGTSMGAEEALFIGGSLNKNEAKKGVPHDDSWYARLSPLFEGDQLDDPVWNWRKEWGHRAEPLVPDDSAAAEDGGVPALPRWMTAPIGPEPRPPRPLAPSAAGEEGGAEPPLPPEAARHAARRGSLIHGLLERLPDVAPDVRGEAARRWLERQAGDLDAALRDEMLGAALGVLDHPEFAALFSPQALAEVPLAATVDGVVVAGTADRLLIEDARITVVDFKTTRRPPASAADIPVATLRQMAAYTAALEVIYPGREVRAGVLYTHAPALFELSPDLLQLHKNALQMAQQSFLPPDIE